MPLFLHDNQTQKDKIHYRFEIAIDVPMPLMNYSNLPSKWSSKYIHSTELHSRILTGFDYLVGHNMYLVTNTHKP